MLSNYPPGVTGNEPEINGPEWEGEIERDCSNGGEVYVISRDLVRRMQKWEETKGQTLPSEVAFMERMLLIAVAHELKSLVPVDIDCPFYGNVDAVIYDGMLLWECPLCGTEYEEEPPFPGDYEPDRSDDPEWDEDY